MCISLDCDSAMPTEKAKNKVTVHAGIIPRKADLLRSLLVVREYGAAAPLG
jgi:hypothetical protein